MHEHAPTIERLGPYRLLEELGAGAMGTVYLAEDVDEEGRFALKVLHPHLLEHEGFFQRFQREAMAGKKVKHPNVVGTLDSGFHVHDGTAYCVLAMEYVEGRTLRDLLREWGTVPEALVRAIGAQVAAGLEAIHQAGIVHRDLKPENVLITADDRDSDHGPRRRARGRCDASPDEGGAVHGVVALRGPGAVRSGRGRATPWISTHWVCSYTSSPSARIRSRTREPHAVMRAHLDEQPVHLDRRGHEVSPFLAEVTATLLQKSPEARFESAGLLQRSAAMTARRPRGGRAAGTRPAQGSATHPAGSCTPRDQDLRARSRDHRTPGGLDRRLRG